MHGLLLTLVLCVSACVATYPRPQCYKYENHAAKYRLRHDRQGYPTAEINLVLGQYPEMKKMFYQDEKHLNAPLNPYLKPLSTVCPHDRYTLFSFFYGTKNCWVIYPDVQRVTYVQCSERACQQCAPYNGVSKCDEDYEYRHVWAYCTHNAIPNPQPQPKPVQPIYPNPQPQPRPVQPIYPNPQPIHPKPKSPTYPVPEPKPHPSDPWVQDPYPQPHKPVYQPKTNMPKLGYPYPQKSYRDPWNRVYQPYVLQHRWRRSSYNQHPRPQPQPPKYGTIERIQLYLPHHCSCKSFSC